MRPAQAIIDLKALCNNYQLAQTISGQKAIAVIKADAYGHGSIECAKALEKNASAFAVACIEEAIELREAGIHNPILLLEGFFEESELPLIEQHHFWPVIHSPWQIVAIEKAHLTKPLKLFLKLDSGMHRVGFFPDQYEKAYTQLMATGKVAKITLITHFARSDELDCDYTQKQYQTFLQATKNLKAETCLCNSPTILAHPEVKSDWVRPGIMLYGSPPFEFPQAQAEQLTPVMTLQSKIISIRELPAGEAVGYGGCFTTKQHTRIGVVAIGYADGYPRLAPNNTPVAVDGKLVPLVGRVSMDMLTIDLTNHPQAGIGSQVELWGKQISATKLASLCGTISYQLFCNLKRVPRLFAY